MVPLPVPELSVAIEALSAFSNIASGAGGTVAPDSDIAVSLVETVWVSVRSTSVKSSVPWVGTLVVRSPPGMLMPPENAMVCGPVVMTGASLVPIIVIVNVLNVARLFT